MTTYGRSPCIKLSRTYSAQESIPVVSQQLLKKEHPFLQQRREEQNE
jgi:hypothetical protein